MEFWNAYSLVLQTIETVVEVAILYLIFQEGRQVVKKVSEIRDSTATVFSETEGLQIGDRVAVRMPQPGIPPSQAPFSTEVWVIREVDKEKNRATASPVKPPLSGPTPTVSGPMTGPLSPFKKLSIAG